MSDETYERFFSEFGAYLFKEKERKIKCGNNDYNPLLAIRSAKDEAKLHTRILHSFLDTNGAHCQDDLFLRFFLETLNLKEWFGDTANARVEKEYYTANGFMDLYIHNGKKHIIVENKVDSGDGDKQIAKYIDSLRKNGYENIAVVYLTKMGDKLSEKSLDKWKINGSCLECGNDNALYRQIAYADEILEWIEKCQSKSGVGNIANLNYALQYYKDIVKIITNKKESVMNIVDFLKDSKDFEIAFEIMKNSKQIKNAYFDRELQKLRDEPQFKGYEILSKDELNTKYGHHIVCNNYGDIAKVIFNKDIEKQTFKIAFCIEDATGNASKCGATKLIVALLVKTNNAKLQNQNLPTRLFELTDSKDFFKSNTSVEKWFWSWNDLWDNIETYKATKFFKEYLGGVNEVNKRLRELESNADSEIAKFASEV